MAKLLKRYESAMADTVQKAKTQGPIGTAAKAIGAAAGTVMSIPSNVRAARYANMANTMKEANGLRDMPIDMSKFNASGNTWYDRAVKTKVMGEYDAAQIKRENAERAAELAKKNVQGAMTPSSGSMRGRRTRYGSVR